MDRPMPDVAFNVMSLVLKIRDLFRPRPDVLAEAHIKPHATVLDFGCGPGSYSLLAADQLNGSGTVYALDIHPLAVQRVQAEAARRGLNNVQTINSDCDTGLPDHSVDVILLHDVFHMFSRPGQILAELHRVLKPEGVLSFSDHHMKEAEIMAGVSSGGLFKLVEKGERSYKFGPVTETLT